MTPILCPYPAYKPSGVPWLSDVPEQWEVRRGKAMLRPVDVRSETGDEELLTVSAQRGVVPRKSTNVTMFKARIICWLQTVLARRPCYQQPVGLSTWLGRFAAPRHRQFCILDRCCTTWAGSREGLEPLYTRHMPKLIYERLRVKHGFTRKYAIVTSVKGGVIPLSVGSNVVTVVVTAEDDDTTRTYTVTLTRAAAPISAPDLDITFVYTFTDPFGYNPSFTLGINVENQGSGSSGSTTLRYYRSTDSAITSGDIEVGTDAVGGLAASGISRETIDLTAPSAPGTYYYGACVDAVSDESDTTNNCSGGIAFVVPAETSTDATLSGLSLSDVNFGTFASGTTSYSASVATSVSQTTVTPTVNDSEATYVIKLGGVTDADGVVSLSVGSNVITVEVTAEDDTTTRTYTVTVTVVVIESQQSLVSRYDDNNDDVIDSDEVIAAVVDYFDDLITVDEVLRKL